jgi:hypothetical protein
MKDLTSLRMFLSDYKQCIDNSFINELISFIFNLKNTYHFIHGTLTIDTLFIKYDANNLEFYVLEFENSKLKVKPFKSTKYNYNDLYSIYYSILDRFPNEPFTNYIYENLPEKYTDIISNYTYN